MFNTKKPIKIGIDISNLVIEVCFSQKIRISSI